LKKEVNNLAVVDVAGTADPILCSTYDRTVVFLVISICTFALHAVFRIEAHFYRTE